MGGEPQIVLCLSTRDGAGCLHPVDWHIGKDTPAPNCDCCSWRKNEPPRSEPARVGPPVGMPAEKWAAMNRAERRAWKRSKR